MKCMYKLLKFEGNTAYTRHKWKVSIFLSFCVCHKSIIFFSLKGLGYSYYFHQICYIQILHCCCSLGFIVSFMIAHYTIHSSYVLMLMYKKSRYRDGHSSVTQTQFLINPKLVVSSQNPSVIISKKKKPFFSCLLHRT